MHGNLLHRHQLGVSKMVLILAQLWSAKYDGAMLMLWDECTLKITVNVC